VTVLALEGEREGEESDAAAAASPGRKTKLLPSRFKPCFSLSLSFFLFIFYFFNVFFYFFYIKS
jgi:hypothetical protein